MIRGTGRWAPHELAVIAMGFLLPLGGDQTVPPWLAYDSVKFLTIAAAAVLLVYNQLGQRPSFALDHRLRRSLVPLIAYGLVLGVASLAWSLPGNRMALYVAHIVATVGAFILAERGRPGAWLDIVYRISVLQLAYHAVVGQRAGLFGEVERLSGGLSAVSLGFVAAMVLGYSIHRFERGKRALSLLVAGLALYMLYATFSRAALVSAGLGILLVIALRGRSRFVRMLVVVGGGVLAYQAAGDALLNALSGAERAGVDTLTGRVPIWQTIIDVNEHWWRGYGYAALRFDDGAGPDSGLYVATGKLPAESGLLNALVMGGVVAAGLWLWFILCVFRDLWRARREAPVAAYFLVVLAVNAVLSNGTSGSPPVFWWVLGALSLLASLGNRADSGHVSAEPPAVVQRRASW
ncbi:O-antigen ligase family protein [Nocardioides iriomotensis]|uniref:O-antigen ligase-related domain-containing protein n=1 Tax=Nocardioides iriomotensis TaxID=715784 RepID=A0A4Q5J757_9ACTN|nr:O-antigen ligase family protein [Nocardioides iriomotensis]RYU13688.1 hypothetical protein ETU37_05455 [Nocardioides iriomotensis]